MALGTERLFVTGLAQIAGRRGARAVLALPVAVVREVTLRQGSNHAVMHQIQIKRLDHSGRVGLQGGRGQPECLLPRAGLVDRQ